MTFLLLFERDLNNSSEILLVKMYQGKQTLNNINADSDIYVRKMYQQKPTKFDSNIQVPVYGTSAKTGNNSGNSNFQTMKLQGGLNYANTRPQLMSLPSGSGFTNTTRQVMNIPSGSESTKMRYQNYKPEFQQNVSSTSNSTKINHQIGASTSKINILQNTTCNPGSSNVSVVQKNVADSSSTMKKDFKLFGTRQGEKLFILTGTVERLIQWHKCLLNTFCYYEVIASVVSLQEGTVRTQKIMLLRDRNGPILQVVYYLLTHIAIDDFHLGKIVRCVGNMIGHNILNAICIRDASQEEVEHLERLTLISEQAVGNHLKH